MEQRLVEIVLPEGRADDITELLYEQSLVGFWRDSVNKNVAWIKILLDSIDVAGCGYPGALFGNTASCSCHVVHCRGFGSP